MYTYTQQKTRYHSNQKQAQCPSTTEWRNSSNHTREYCTVINKHELLRHAATTVWYWDKDTRYRRAYYIEVKPKQNPTRVKRQDRLEEGSGNWEAAQAGLSGYRWCSISPSVCPNGSHFIKIQWAPHLGHIHFFMYMLHFSRSLF